MTSLLTRTPARKSFLIIAVLFAFILPSLYAQNLTINEWMADNNSFPDEVGEFDDWIELYNAGNVDIDINGFYLSDDLADPLKFQLDTSVIIPPGGFLLLWADDDSEQGKLHLNFKLGASGEDILLSDSNGALIDQVTFGQQSENISFGRFPDGSSDLFFFDDPSPGSENAPSGNISPTLNPDFSAPGGFYNTTLSIEISSATPGATIFYTTNGDDPDDNSTLYTGAIEVDESSVIRAIAYANNHLPSAIISHGYFLNESYTLPLLSIVTDPDNMFGSDGIYSNPYEEGPEWERYCQIQYFKNDNLEFSEDCGIRIQGNSSVGNDKKSFRLFFRSDYGVSRLEYPMFDGSDVTDFNNLVLRAGYDDDILESNGTLLRDPLGNRQYERSGGLHTEGNWAILTINGEYWGVYNIRESMNEEFVESHTGFSDMDMLRFKKFDPELRAGTMEDFDNLRDFLENNDFSNETNYNTAAELIDMDNLANLLAFTQCSGYTSWSYGISTYKENVPGGKWEFSVWDMDRSHFITSWDPHDDFESDGALTYANFYNRALTENETFRNKLVNRTADLLNTIYKSQEALDFLTAIKSEIIQEMPREYERWNPSEDVDDWNDNLEKMETFLQNRPNKLRDYILDHYNFSGTNDINLDVTGEGFIKISTIDITTFPWSGIYFEDVPVRLEAIPGPGYIFSGWSDSDLPNESTVEVMWNGTFDLTAFFELGSTEVANVVINEINYNSADDPDSGDWIELLNASDETVDLSGWFFKDESNSYFNIPENTELLPNNFLILAEDLNKFQSVFPTITNVIGTFQDAPFGGFKLANSGELISISNADGSYSDLVEYDDKDPWPEAADGDGPSLQLLDAFSDNAVALNWMAFQPTPGSPNVSPDNPIDQSINFPQPIDRSVIDQPFEIDATASSGLPVSFQIISGPASIQGNTITLNGTIGTVVVLASQAGNIFYNPASDVEQSFEVLEFVPEDQVIQFAPLADRYTTDLPFDVDATASSGLAVSFSIASGPATIQGNTITLNGQVGTVTVRASQSGDANYNPAIPVDQSFQVLEPPVGEPEDYCTSEGEQPWTERIIRVQFGTIDHTSAKEGYADFTDQSTIVNAGNIYPLAITPKFSYTHYDSYYNVWIDYNRDGDFEDPAENVLNHFQVAGEDGTDAEIINSMIMIPGAISPGSTRMRVSMKRDAFAGPCEIFEFGEVEDYTVILNGASGPVLSVNCPEDIFITLPFQSTGTIVDFNAPAANSTCADQNIQINQTAGAASGSFFNPGQYTISYDVSDQCGNQQTCSFLINIALEEEEEPSTEYCESEGEQPWNERIINFSLTTINNDSGKDGYGDFTDLIAQVNQGQSYAFSLQPKFSWTHYDETYTIWIDFNQDFDFTDPGEEVFSQFVPAGENGTDAAPVSGTIHIPLQVELGTTRMRVSMKRDLFADPCEIFERGEVEDYTVEILFGGTNQSFVNQSGEINSQGKTEQAFGFDLFPNPVNNQLSIQLKEYEEQEGTIILINAMQQQVGLKEIDLDTGSLTRFNLNHLPAGIYSVLIILENGTLSSRQFIKK